MNATETIQLAGLLAITFLCLPAMGWFCSFHHPKTSQQRIVIFGLVVAAGTVLHFGRIELRYRALEMQLAGYDRNSDGNFSREELTPAVEAALRNHASDTARALAPYVALPVALVWTTLNYGGLSLLAWGFYALRGRRWPEQKS